MKCQFCDVVHSVAVPTVHTNGSGAANLRDELQEAVDALREAEHRLIVAQPNGRDYYPQGPEATPQAMREHNNRCVRLRRTIEELEEQLSHVQAVIDYKESLRASRAIAAAPGNRHE